jgi:site-specific DNA recombinase
MSSLANPGQDGRGRRRKTPSGPERAALYPRVSGKSQEEDGTSLGTQEARMRAYARSKGYTVDDAHVLPEVHTGTELWERPLLTKLREFVRRRDVDVVIAYAIDRLSRDPVHLGVILAEADHAGARVEFVTEPLDDSPEGPLIRFVRGYAAKIEHEKIKERTLRGKRARAEAGKLVPGCRPRYGYRFTAGKASYRPDPATATIVRRMFALAEQGVTVRGIAARLSEDGVPTPARAARAWSHTTVRTILRDPIYTGQGAAWRFVVVRDRQRGTKNVRWRDPSERVTLPTGTVPTLVDASTFAAVQTRLRLNQERAARNNRAPHLTLLRGGFARCGHCGYAMQAQATKGGRRGYGAVIYRCARASAVDGEECQFNIRAAILDRAAWEPIEALLRNPASVRTKLEQSRTADPSADDLAGVERSLARVARQQRNLVEQLANLRGAAADLVAQKLAVLETERERLGDERAALLARQEAWRAGQERLDEFERWCATVAADLGSASYDEKRRALDLLNVRVRVWRTGHDPRYEVSASVGLASAAAASSSVIPGFTPGGNCEMNSRRLFHGSTT